MAVSALEWHHASQWGFDIAAAMAAFLLLLAWKYGAAAERWLAGAFALRFPLTLLQQWAFGFAPSSAPFSHFMPDIFAQDLLLLAVFTALALRANRLYPLWIAAAQVIVVTTHLVQLCSSQLLPRAYATLVGAPTLLQSVIILIGLAFHARRTSQCGAYPSWRAT